MELRCENKLHGLLDEAVIEVKCNSRFCGHGDGVVVFHRFDARTGELIETRKFRETRKDQHAASHQPSALRSA